MTTFKPTKGKNTNCMEGRICPKCGNEDKLWIWAKIQLEMTDDGTSDAYADHEYDDDAPTECPDCGFKAPLSVFDGQPAPVPPTGAEIAQVVKQAQEEAKAIDAYREALQAATVADEAFGRAIKAQFGQNSNRFDHAREEFNAETKAAYQAKLAADEAWHKARHNAANQARLALDDETCPKCGKLHDFCRHCKKVRVSCGDSDHDPFALIAKRDIELNGKYEAWEK